MYAKWLHSKINSLSQQVCYVKFHTRKWFILACGSNVVVLYCTCWHISTSCISFAFGIPRWCQIKGENVTPDCKLPVCQSVMHLQVTCLPVSYCKVPVCKSVSHWQVCSLQRQVAFLFLSMKTFFISLWIATMTLWAPGCHFLSTYCGKPARRSLHVYFRRAYVRCWLGKRSVGCRADWSVECRASNSECRCQLTLILVWMSVSDGKNGLVSGVGNTPFMGPFRGLATEPPHLVQSFGELWRPCPLCQGCNVPKLQIVIAMNTRANGGVMS